MNEYIVLLNNDGQKIGTAEKLASHNADTPLHLAFSCYIFNESGQFLVTQRAHSKKVWPGVLTNSVCGHPAPDESTEDAIVRRASYEIGLGVQDIKLAVSHYRYKTPPYNGIVEHEECPIYVARTTRDPIENPDEVVSWRWQDWKTYVSAAQEDTENLYSWWCKDQLKLLIDHPVIEAYAKPI